MLAQMFSSRSARPLALATVGALAAVGLFAAPAGAATPQTTTSPAKAAAGWLAQQFTNHFDYAGSTFFDGGTTADAIFALSAAGVGKDQDRLGDRRTSRKHVDDYTSLHDKTGKPGRTTARSPRPRLPRWSPASTRPTSAATTCCTRSSTTSARRRPHRRTARTPDAVCPRRGRTQHLLQRLRVARDPGRGPWRGEVRVGLRAGRPALSYFLSLQCANGGFTVGDGRRRALRPAIRTRPATR